MSHDHYISNFLSRPPSTDAHWQYHSVTRDINELIAYHWKEKKDAAAPDDRHLRIWQECLRVQGELKRKFEGGDETKAGVGKRRLVTLFEANEVARRLAGSHHARGSGARVPSDVVSHWL